MAVRNVLPYTAQAARASIIAVQDYIPERLFGFLQGVSESIKSSGIDAFAETSVSGTFVNQVTEATVATSESAILIGCILIYIALVLVLIFLVAFIVKVLTGDFAAYMSFGPFGFIGINPPRKKGGNRFTRNNRQMKRHRKHKKTHKRSK